MTAEFARPLKHTVSPIVRNSMTLLGGQYVNRVLTVLFFVILSRTLTEADIGRYAIATTLASLLTAVVVFGLDRVIERRVARNRPTATLLLHAAFVGQVALWAVSLPFAVVALYLVATSHDVVTAGIWLLPWVLGSSLIMLLGAVFRGLERMEYHALLTVIAALQLLVYTVVALFVWRTMVSVVAAMVAERAVTSCVGYALLRRLAREEGWARAPVGGQLPRQLLRAALPFAGVAITGLLYQRIDVLILARFVSDTRVGHYATAYRILEMLILVPGMIATAAFPLMARTAKADPAAYRRHSGAALQYSLAMMFPVIIGIFYLATPLVQLLFGEAYTPAAASLRVLVWGLVFECINNTVGRGIIAGEGERHLLTLSLVALGSNLGLNFMLIPMIGELGAAWATVGSFAVSTVLHLVVAGRLKLLPGCSKSLRAATAAVIGLAVGTLAERLVENTAVAVATLVYAVLLQRFGVATVRHLGASVAALRNRATPPQRAVKDLR